MLDPPADGERGADDGQVGSDGVALAMVDRPACRSLLAIRNVASSGQLPVSLLSFRSGRVSVAPRREENRDRAGAYRPPESLMHRLVLPVQGLALAW